MSKTIVLGDIHGRPIWKDIVNTQEWDKVIFIGDYFDSWVYSVEEQLHNFKDICEFKKSQSEKVIMLIGNHCYHYTSHAMSQREHYSGYSIPYARSINEVLTVNKELTQMCYSQDDFLFTHAGITKTWLGNAIEQSKVSYEDNIEEYINNLYIYKPILFQFTGYDPYGDNITQSPIWVRPDSLMADGYGDGDYKQIVGHTTVGKINPDGIDNKFFFIDALEVGEYLIIEDGKISVGRVNKDE